MPGPLFPSEAAIPIATVLVALFAGAGLFLAYQVAGILLLIFAGMLLAVVLDAGTVGLGRVLPIGRLWRLGIVSLAILAFVTAVAIWGGVNLGGQMRSLAEVAVNQAEVIGEWLEGYGIPIFPNGGENGGEVDFWQYLPAPETLFGHAQTAFGLTLSVVGNIVILAFLGLFFAVDPAGYRDGFLRLLPVERRARVGAVLTEAGHALRWWLLGQIAMMALVAVSIGLMLRLVGVPNAFLLGALAGLLNFIPFLGPILASIPVFLATMPEGMVTLALVMTLFVVIQSIEGYLIGPMIQERVVDLPPAWTLTALVVFGALFGGIGVALATPLLAVARILVIRLYIEDVLERPRRA